MDRVWEYEVTEGHVLSKPEMNELGIEGWELVAIISSSCQMYWKREVFSKKMPEIRELILDILREDGGDMRMMDVVRRLPSSVNRHTARTTMLDMRECGIIERPRRGVYRLPKEEGESE
jgi:hypothetical protein